MKRNLFIVLLSLVNIISCAFREIEVDKSKLKGSDYRQFQNTPAWELAKAVWDEDVEEINSILAKDPKLVDYREEKYGQTLLFLTISNQQYDSFIALIENKADVNIHDTFDATSPLIESLRFKWYDIRFPKKLIEKGADVNYRECGKRTSGNTSKFFPLLSAVSSGNLEFVKLLIGNGANVNPEGEKVSTLLSSSLCLEEYEITYFLLQHGADFRKPLIYRPDYSNSTAQNPKCVEVPIYFEMLLRELMVELGSPEHKWKMKIVEFLKQHGVDYYSAPIPEYNIERAKELYPDSWEEYLKKY